LRITARLGTLDFFITALFFLHNNLQFLYE